MSTSIKIEINGSTTPEIIHRFRNFGEDLYRALRGSCFVDIEEIDKATTQFTIADIPTALVHK